MQPFGSGVNFDPSSLSKFETKLKQLQSQLDHFQTHQMNEVFETRKFEKQISKAVVQLSQQATETLVKKIVADHLAQQKQQYQTITSTFSTDKLLNQEP